MHARITIQQTFLIPKIETLIFQTESVLLSCFVLREFVWRSYADCHLDSGSQWWTQISSSLEIWDRSLIRQCPTGGTRSAVIVLLVSLCATVRIGGTQAAQTLAKTLSAVVALALNRVEHVIRLVDVTVAAQRFINSVVVLQHR